MSSHVISGALIGALLAGAAFQALAAEPRSTLSCLGERPERAAFKEAPGGAKRPSKHVLVVATAKGPQRFTDEPPYDEELAGVRWTYCGYDAQAKVHLIGKNADSDFTGVLLMEASGKQVPAGHTVTFAPDRGAFVAREQQDGMDGEYWTIKDFDGKVTWKGYGGIPGRKPDSHESQFTEARWTASEGLTARFECMTNPDITGNATFVRAANGKWSWRADRKCPKE